MKNRAIQRRRARKWQKKFDEQAFGIPMEWTYSVDFTFAKFIVPVLTAFKEVNNGYPYTLTPEQWDEIIQKMIEGFKILADDNGIDNTVEQETKIEEAFDLFRKWARQLWW